MTSTNWALVNNALDFMERSVAEMASDDAAEDKYATIHLFSAIEVLIKARLMREHWTLACKKVDGAREADFNNGLVETVSPGQGLKRLQDVAGLTIDRQHADHVSSVGRLRNRAIHFALIGEQPLAIKATLGRGLDFLLWFLGTHIKPGAPTDETEIIEKAMDTVSGELGEIQALVKERMKTIASQLSEAEAVVVCPRCQQPTMLFEAASPPARCAFCLWSPDGEEAAQEYVSVVLGLSSYVVVKDGGEWPVHTCTECGAEALVEGIEVVTPSGPGANPGAADITWACFECTNLASDSQFDRCTRCGQLVPKDDEGMSVCGDCIDYIVGRD